MDVWSGYNVQQWMNTPAYVECNARQENFPFLEISRKLLALVYGLSLESVYANFLLRYSVYWLHRTSLASRSRDLS